MWYTKNLRIAQVANIDLTQDYETLKQAIPGAGAYAITPSTNNLFIKIGNDDKITDDEFEGSLSEIIKKVLASKFKEKVKDPKPTQRYNPNKTGNQAQGQGPKAATPLIDSNQPAQQAAPDTSGVKANARQLNKALELISPKDSNGLFLWDFADEYVEDYNKLVDAEYSIVTTITPDNSEKGYNLEVSIGNTPAGVDPNFIQLLKNYIINNAVFKLATDGKGDFKQSEHTIYFKKKTNITPAQFQKTFITPTLINSRIGDPIKLKIDGRDIKTVRNGENVILDPNDLYLTKGKHIIEFVSNNADQNLNADKSDFLSYQINVTDGQKLSLIGSARGSFPNLYNRAPPSTERQRIEQELRDRRRPPTKETDKQKIAIEEALKTEAITNGLKTQVYNTAMQKYDFDEVKQYIEEIMRNRALYATPQKRKDYAESLKRERGRVRQQSTVDALLQPRPTQPGA